MSFNPGGSGGSGAIRTGSDVALSNPINNETLRFDGPTQKWMNAANTLSDGSVTKAKLETSVQTSLGKADTAVRGVGITRIEAVAQGQAGVEAGVLYVELAA